MRVKNCASYLSQQRGWVVIEMGLCLTLLAIVLYVSQKQSREQWQSIELAEREYHARENAQKRVLLSKLVGSLDEVNKTELKHSDNYPNCIRCSGKEFIAWFQASQHHF